MKETAVQKSKKRNNIRSKSKSKEKKNGIRSIPSEKK